MRTIEKDFADKLFARLAAHGVTELRADYSGDGDSGQFDGCTYTDEKGVLTGIDFDKPEGEAAALRAVTNRLTDKKTQTFEQDIEQLVWECIDVAGHSGFENNDGGEGKLIIDVVARTIVLDHNDFYTESRNSEHTLYGEDEDEDEESAPKNFVGVATGIAP